MRPRSTSTKTVTRKVAVQTKASEKDRLEYRIRSRNWRKMPKRETRMIEDKTACKILFVLKICISVFGQSRKGQSFGFN